MHCNLTRMPIIYIWGYHYRNRYYQYFHSENALEHDVYPLHWHHNDHDDVSNHQPHSCLLNRLFRRNSKKTSKLRVTGLSVGNSPGPVNSAHKGPVTRKMFPFDDVIMRGFDISRGMPIDLPQTQNTCGNKLYWVHASIEEGLAGGTAEFRWHHV